MSTNFYIANQLLVLFAPALAVILGRLPLGEKLKTRLLISGHAIAFICALIELWAALNHAKGDFILGQGCLQLHADGASAGLLAGITFISTVVVAFSDRYLGGDKFKQSFLSLISLLSSISALLVVSNNLFLTFVCLHLLSWGLWRIMCLQKDARGSASVVLGHHFASDLLFLAALSLIWNVSGTATFTELPSRLASFTENFSLFGSHLPFSNLNVISLLLVLSFSIKSALFPFHKWLLATLDAPTPLSGFLHAGVVNVSAIIAYRLMPVLVASPVALFLWAGLSILSAVVCTISMSAQPDVKRKLLYSTVGQMGFMCLQCASGAYAAAFFHLLAHGFFKCYMFLQSGSTVAEGQLKRQFAFADTALDASGRLKRLLFLSSTATLFSFAFALVSINSGATAISAVLAASAILAALPAVTRVDFRLLACFWIASLGLAFGAVIGHRRLEHMLISSQDYDSGMIPILLLALGFVSIVIWVCRKTKLAQSLYVHGLNGFYIAEMASAIMDFLKVKRNQQFQLINGNSGDGRNG